jgi:hypothetical protein
MRAALDSGSITVSGRSLSQPTIASDKNIVRIKGLFISLSSDIAVIRPKEGVSLSIRYEASIVPVALQSAAAERADSGSHSRNIYTANCNFCLS